MGIRVSNKIFLPQYHTIGMRTAHSTNYLTKVRKQIKSIFPKIGLAYQEIKLNIDGGNFVTNDKVAIITERAILDNHKIDVRKYLNENLNLEPIFIKNSDDDLLCHSDGEVSFINEKTVMHSSYPFELSSLYEERLLLSANQNKLIENRFNVINVYDRPINGKEIYNDLYLHSARGIYINNIILNNTVILPEFNIPSYKRTINYNKLNKTVYENLGFEVKTINCDELGYLGGGLHCVS